MTEQEYTPTEADREDAKLFLIGLSLDGTDETPQSLPAEGVDDIVAELAALFAKVRADERAKRPDREQIETIIADGVNTLTAEQLRELFIDPVAIANDVFAAFEGGRDV